ncbi:MAG TPA: ABC transporter ATP-binding protein [Polyangiaceae bacterium]|nr:ABC transporter ATP-binding protein [Polyangiaceae bacterium]
MFGATAALRSVDVSFEAGTISLLEGPNGAGKSTLLSVIGTVLRPTSGDVEYSPVGSEVELVRPHLGWLAHDSHCYRELSVWENLRFAARVHGLPVEQALEDVAGRVEIRHLRDRRVGLLSRGQRQRVALARALIHRPSVLLLDEPWTGLDAASAAHLEEVIREEGAAGTLIVVVSHDDSVGKRLNARRVRLEGGRIKSSE